MGKKEINILYTTMSTLNRNVLSENTYYWDDGENKELYSGISQLESGAKHILSHYSIDKIVVVGSDLTFCEDDEKYFHVDDVRNVVIDDLDFSEGKDAFRFFLYRISLFLNGKDDTREGVIPADKGDMSDVPFAVPFSSKPVALVFVKQVKQALNNINEILAALRENTGSKKINLFIDMQGGNRTSSYVNNAVFSMIHYDNKSFDFSIKKVIATNFTPGKPRHEVVDETKQYFINRLVIGMNEFLYYGKAASLDAYMKNTEVENIQVRNLVEIMKEIDKWMSVCSTENLIESVRKLKTACETYEPQNDVFDIVVERIAKDYKDIFENVDNYSQLIIELIRWSLGKKFYQQALTIFEAKIPFILVERKICYYADSEDEKKTALGYFIKEYNKTANGRRWMFNDLSFWYIRSCVSEFSSDVLDRKYIKKNDSKGLCDRYRVISKTRNNINHAKGADNDPESLKLMITQYLKDIEEFAKGTPEINQFMISQKVFDAERRDNRK